jgi:hypothetical protein
MISSSYQNYSLIKFIMKTYILLLFVILPQFFLSAQNNIRYNSEVKKKAIEKWEETERESMSNTYHDVNFEYTPVEGLSVESASYLNSESYSRLTRSVIQSSDKQFLSVIEVAFSPLAFPVYTKNMKNTYYTNKIIGHFLDIAWEYDESCRDKISIKDLMENIPLEYAEEIFDSDTVTRYSLSLKELFTKDQTKYTKCDVLIRYNNDLCPIFFYCFYTDEGYENRKAYMENLEKSIHFKNDSFRKDIRALFPEDLDELNLKLQNTKNNADTSKHEE